MVAINFTPNPAITRKSNDSSVGNSSLGITLSSLSVELGRCCRLDGTELLLLLLLAHPFVPVDG